MNNNLQKISDFEDKSLLIVDDDNPFRDRLARAMEKKGFSVSQAEGVKKGIELIKSTKREFKYIASKKGQFVDYSDPQSTLIIVFKDKKLVRWYTEDGNSGDSNKKLSKFESIIPPEILFGVILPTIITIGLL